MLQHRFSLQFRWEEVAHQLLPMIQQCQQFLAEADAAAAMPQTSSAGDGLAATLAAGGGGDRALADAATGQFSWRMPPEGTGKEWSASLHTNSMLSVVQVPEDIGGRYTTLS